MNASNTYWNLKVIFIATFVGIINSFCYLNFTIMIALCALEVILLMLAYIRRNYVQYVCLYMIFLTFSMESDNFVGGEDFYGFKNFRILGVNLATWMLMPLLFDALRKLRSISDNLEGLHLIIFKRLTFFTLCGSLMGAIVYMLDDYGFRSKEGSLKEFVNSYYSFYIPYITIFVISWIVITNKSSVYKIKQYLFACIPATAIVFILCLILGNYGNRAGSDSLQVSEIYFLLIGSLILISFNEFTIIEKSVILFSGCVIASLSIFYNASGKILIIMMLTPVLWLIVLYKQGIRLKIYHYLILFVLILYLPDLLGLIMGVENNTLSSKLDDVTGLLNFFFLGDGLMLIPGSPQMRITEFMNVGYEYIVHPWYAFFGKGFAGSIKDLLNLFPELDEAAFPEWQLQLGAYHGLHESFNLFFLIGGFSGLYILFNSIYQILKRMNYSAWLVIGGMWFFLFYGYHMNVSIYGITALVIGLNEITIKECKSPQKSKSM